MIKLTPTHELLKDLKKNKRWAVIDLSVSCVASAIFLTLYYTFAGFFAIVFLIIALFHALKVETNTIRLENRRD